jgi:tetrahydromethanopterin S-methyltransferase subunit G
MEMTQQSAQDWGSLGGKYVGSLLWSAAPGILLGALVGLVLAIVLIVFLRKRQLLKRHTFAWNMLAKIGYVAILVAVPLGAGAIGGVYRVQSRVNADVDTVVRPLVASEMPGLRKFLVQELRNAGAHKMTSMKELLRPLKERFSYVRTSDGRWERFKGYCVNDVLVEPTFGIIAETLENKLRDKLNAIGEKVFANNEVAQTVASLGATVLVRSPSEDALEVKKLDGELIQVVMSNLFKHLNAAFSPLYSSVAFMLLALAFLLAAEIGVYYRWFRPRPPANSPGA